MGGALFGKASRQNQNNPVAISLRVQSSLQGRPIALVYGQARVAGNIVWYNGFVASPAKSPGGKGGVVSSVLGKGSGNYDYSVSAITSLCEGPIVGLLTIYNGNAINFLVPPSATVLADLVALGIIPSYDGLGYFSATFFDGSFPQDIWSVLSTFYPSQAIPYPGETLVAFENLALGESPSFPNFNWEVLTAINSDVPDLGPDANPSDVITDFLTNSDHGVQGFPAALVGDLSTLQNYSRASGLMISPALTDQQAASNTLADWMKGLACDFFWSSGFLQVTPYADQPVAGNGFTFIPDTTPVYNLDYDDFLENQGTLGNNSSKTPVAIARKDPTTILNMVQLEYLDRSNIYNPVTIYASNDALITSTGRLRLSDLRSHHFFCLASAAGTSVQLQLAREQIANQYQFTLGREFILLDPMDIVTLTSPPQGLNNTPVRITEIQENSDGTLTMTAEEFLGTVGPALYPRQQPLGTALNYNAPPGDINTPFFFEPPDELAGGLQVWAIISGKNQATWGGAYVWVSADAGATYQQLPGQLVGNSRQGALTASLAAVVENPIGQTIDNTNTCSVDLSESTGSLASGTVPDMTALNTLCLVDQELISYQTATLTGANEYGLAPMVRGAYSTTIAAHSSGAPFAAFGALSSSGSNAGIYAYAYPQGYIGQTLYFKFQSFNGTGGGVQPLDTINPFTYTLTGAALSSPLPNVSNLVTVFNAGFLELSWDQIVDFRPGIRYLIKKGSSFTSAVQIGDVAHPPFTVPGSDTYWVTAYCQVPNAPGLTVFSEAAQSIVIGGNTLTQNVVKTSNQQAENWPGTLTNITASGVSGSEILSMTTIGLGATGSYHIDTADEVDVGYVAACSVNMTWESDGVPEGQNVLTFPNVLTVADFLGTASSQFISVVPQIRTATTESLGVPNWTSWQNFTPGVYLARWLDLQWNLTANADAIIPTLLSGSFEVQVETRTDHYSGKSINSSGTTITFEPDGAGSTAPFNGGPNSSALPFIGGFTATTAGDTIVVTALSLSSVTLQIFNNGSAVSRTGQSFTATGF